MKFLCVDCDEPMSLTDKRGPDRGSMTVVFSCPACGRRTAMLTNASETQVVRSLGVRIGGGTVDAEPMQGIRSGLVPDEGAAHGASRCPFTGMVNEAYDSADIGWTEGARARIDRIPSYARSMVKKGVEEFAREEGLTEVTEAVLDRARGRMGL